METLRHHLIGVANWVLFLLRSSLLRQPSRASRVELPVLSRWKVLGSQIDQGMRSGIRSKEMRTRTIPLDIDKAEFDTALDIPTEDTFDLFLVDCDGNILWRDTGTLQKKKDTK